MAGLHFDITGDNKNLLRNLEGSKQGIRSLTREADKESVNLDDIMKRIGRSAAAIGIGFSATQLIRDVAKVRGEFQQLEVALTTMLGSEEKANTLFQQLVNTAAKTPFDLKGVASGAKQLLAYGVAAEEVNDTIIRLGDIAAGLSIPLGDLVYLYGTTMTQGRLFTQDLRQFMGRGIPLADELAKQFGVAKDEVGGLVTAGKVGFAEVEKAIKSMTSEGGKFAGLMENQSKTITGQISNLEDAVDSMFNEIGKSTQGAISEVLSTTTELVENYERVLEIIGALVATYGSYKAVLVTTSAFESAASKAKYGIEIAELEALLPLKQASANADIESAVASGRMTQSEAEKVIALRQEAKAYIEKLEAARIATAHDAAVAMEKKRVNLQEIADTKAQIVNLRELGKAKEADALTTKLQSLENKKETLAVQAETMAELANKAATDANTASNALNATSQNANTKATNLLTAAKLKLAQVEKSLITTMSNPYVKAAIAIAALAFGIYKLITAKTAEEKAIEKVNSEREESLRLREEEKANINSLLGVIKDENQTKTAQIRAYKELGQYLPKLTSLYSLEALQAESVATYEKAINAELEQRDYDTAKNGIDEYKAKLEELERLHGVVSNMGTPWGSQDYAEEYGLKSLTQYMATVAIEREIRKATIANEIADYKERLKQAEEFVKNYEDIQREAAATPLEKAKEAQAEAQKAYDDALKQVENKISVMKTLIKGDVENWEDWLPAGLVAWLKAKEEALKLANKAVEDASSQSEVTKNKEYWEKAKKQAETDRDSLDVSLYGTDEWKKYDRQAKEAERMLQRYSGKYEEVIKKRNDEIIRMQESTSEDLLYIQGKELDTELANIQRSYEKQIREIDEQEREWREAQGGKLDQQQLATISNARDAALKKKTKDEADVRIEYEKKIGEELKSVSRQTEDDLLEIGDDAHNLKMAQIRRNYEDRINEIREQEKAWKDAQGGVLTQEQQTAINNAVDAAERKREYSERKQNKDNLDNMLADILSYEQARQQVEERYSKKRKNLYKEDGVTLKEGITEDNLRILEQNRDDALEVIDEEFASKSQVYLGWVDSISDMTIKQLNKTLDEANDELAQLEGDENADPEKLAIARAKIAELQKKIEQLQGQGDEGNKRSIDTWKDLGEVLGDTASEFEALGNAIGGTTGEIVSSLGSTFASTVGLMSNITQFVEICQKGIKNTAGTAVSAVKAVEAASVILAIISIAIQVIQKIADVAKNFNNKPYEKSIEDNQEKIDNLKESYDALEEVTEDAYGSDKVSKLREMNANLERQNELIRQQMKEEEQVKQKDSEYKAAMDEYSAKLEENIKKQEENKKAAEEAIFGEDIQSAIDNFAQAYGDAIAEGKDLSESMKDHAVKMMKQMVQEEIKEYIAGQGKMEALREKMELYFTDGVFSDSEIAAIKAEAVAIGRDLDKKFAWAEDLLAEEDGSSSSSSKRGIATASQESVDENNGRLMSIQLSMGELKDQMIYTVTYLASMSSSMSSSNHILSDIREQAVRTNGHLEDIVKYTKPLNDKLTEVVSAVNKINSK